MEKSYTEQIQIRKTNPIAALYPSAKFWIMVLYTVCLFVLSSYKMTRHSFSLLLIPWLLVPIVLCICSGVFRPAMKGLKAIFKLSIMIFVIQTFFVTGGEVMFQFGFIRICEAGAAGAISVGFTIFDMASIFIWFFQTTKNSELVRALQAAGMNHKTVFTFSSTLNMVSVLKKSSDSIMDAQRARGVETEGNLLVRAKAFMPALIPLVLQAIMNAEEKVLTLDARGFQIEGKRTYLLELQRTGKEKPAVTIAAVMTGMIIAWRIAVWIM